MELEDEDFEDGIRTMIQAIAPVIPEDTENKNKIFFGRENRYKIFDLDYETNIKPKVLYERITNINKINIQETPDVGLDIAYTFYLPFLKNAFQVDFPSMEHQMIFKNANDNPKEARIALRTFCQKKGLAGWLSYLELDFKEDRLPNEVSELLKEPFTKIIPFSEISEDGNEKRKQFLSILSFLAVIDEKAVFRDIIPKSMYTAVKDYLKCMVEVLSAGYYVSFPDGYFEKIKYISAKHPNPESEAFKIDSMDGIRVTGGTLIINGYEFRTSKDKRFLESIMSLDNKFLLNGICFQDCCFNIDPCYFGSGLFSYGNLFFQNCRIDKTIHLKKIMEGQLEFENCQFIGGLDISCPNLDSIHIDRCLFEKGAFCSISSLLKDDYGDAPIQIKNTQFNGELKFSDTKNKIFIKMENVSFGYPFQVDGIKLKKYSEFENLCFSSIPSSQMDKSRRDLYEAMKNAGLEQRAKDLGILPSEKETTNVKFDYDAYQIAYNSGFLKPEYAAYFLGKSKVYLQKKRTQDKQKITRDSLPFKIDGRDVQYPVEALLAFKAKDWDTLKNLRKKYPIPTD